MGYWAHSWQLDELLVGDDVRSPETMQYWSDVEQTAQYTDGNNVTVECKYDHHLMEPILQQQQYRRFADVGANPIHDCQWENYLTENDPNRWWVDDEGNWLAPQDAPSEARGQLNK